MKDLYSDMFSAFQPIIEKRMLKLISFGRDYCDKGVGTSERNLSNHSSKENKGSNGGCECGKVPSAGGKVVMQQVGIPQCAAASAAESGKGVAEAVGRSDKIEGLEHELSRKVHVSCSEVVMQQAPHLRPLNHLHLLAA